MNTIRGKMVRVRRMYVEMESARTGGFVCRSLGTGHVPGLFVAIILGSRILLVVSYGTCQYSRVPYPPLPR